MNRILFLFFLLFLGFSLGAFAKEHCLVRPESPVSLKRFNVPASVANLSPQIVMPSEGRLQFLFADRGEHGDEVWSPTGDFSPAIGPYDPKSGRLYVWGYYQNGWVEVRNQSGNWLFEQRGLLKPRLFEEWVDGRGDSVRTILRSPALGLLFYQGTTAKHWLTQRRSYRIYQIDGSEVTRVPELEARKLQYIGDDPVTKLAVFYPNNLLGDQSHLRVWYDGKSVIEPPSETAIPSTWCN